MTAGTARGGATARKTAARRLSVLSLGLATAAGAAWSAGCREGAGEPVVVRDSAGVEIVESREPAWSPGQAWRVGREPRLSIGTADGPEGQQLFRVGDALRLSDGRILVENRGTSEVRVFGPDGAFLHAVGGPGEGPGELREVGGLAVSGDSLFVLDRGLGRISLFDLDGAFRLSFRLDPTGDPVRPLRLYRLSGRFSDGSFLLAPRAFPADMRERPTLFWDSVPHLLYSGNGALRDTIGTFGGLEIFATPEFSTMPPFARHSVAALRQDRFVVGRSFAWRLESYGPDGRLLRVVRRTGKPPPVTPEGAARILEGRLAGIEDEERRRRTRDRYDALELPERMPAYSDLVVDGEGHLWVKEYRPPWETGPEAWNVFSPEGRWLGSVDLPEGLRATDVGPDWILGVRRGALEVEHVELYELERDG